MNRWFLLKSGVCEPAFNMALDEALIEAMPRLQSPVFRLYGWTEPAASFGYFQKFAAVELMTALRPLVRRPTAGGLVPHDADWTYSLAFPTHHEWYSVSAVESYRRVHEWLRRGFAILAIETRLAPCRLQSQGQCFLGYEQSDLLWQGKKIAGAAQRRTKAGLLIQGSVQSTGLKARREDWEKAMCSASPYEFDLQWEELDAGGELLNHAKELVAQKYSRISFNQRR